MTEQTHTEPANCPRCGLEASQSSAFVAPYHWYCHRCCLPVQAGSKSEMQIKLEDAEAKIQALQDEKSRHLQLLYEASQIIKGQQAKIDEARKLFDGRKQEIQHLYDHSPKTQGVLFVLLQAMEVLRKPITVTKADGQ